MKIRRVESRDADAWLRMRQELWPDTGDSHAREIKRFFSGVRRDPLEVLLAFDEGGDAIGFAELSIRSHVDGCSTGRVGYLEGWYVSPAFRRRGVGRSLVAAAEEWARSQGCLEFGSDTPIDNATSAAAHQALGFEETARVHCFRKSL